MNEKQILIAVDNARRDLGVSETALCEMTNCQPTRHAYSKWMRGLMVPNLKSLIPICEVLGLELIVRKKEAAHD